MTLIMTQGRLFLSVESASNVIKYVFVFVLFFVLFLFGVGGVSMHSPTFVKLWSQES